MQAGGNATMYLMLLALFCILGGLWTPKFFTSLEAQRRYVAVAGFAAAALVLLWSSCYVVSSGQVGHLQRIYFGASLPQGSILARAGQNGSQIMPGSYNLNPAAYQATLIPT